MVLRMAYQHVENARSQRAGDANIQTEFTSLIVDGNCGFVGARDHKSPYWRCFDNRHSFNAVADDFGFLAPVSSAQFH